MPSLKETKRRITSVKSTQKITRAMKLVSSAKFARANQGVLNARPYANAFRALVARLGRNDDVVSGLAQEREIGTSVVFVMAPDRGLCGSLNANLLKKAQAVISDQLNRGVEVQLVLWGKRSHTLASKFPKATVIDKQERVLDRPTYDLARRSAEHLQDLFRERRVDTVVCLFNRFKSALSQVAKSEVLLPVKLGKVEAKDHQVDYIVEPDTETVVDSLLAKSVTNRLFSMLLESSASEHAARMTAMDNATNNAEEVIKKLTLEYNRARQAAITKELIEITSGAEAL